jgi:hypothetical protein
MRIAQAAQMIRHDAVAIPAERGQIAELFVTKALIRAVMHLDCAEAAIVVTDSAAETGGFEFGKPSRVLTPAATRDVVVVVHDWCSVVRWNNVGDIGAQVNNSMEKFQRSQRHG